MQKTSNNRWLALAAGLAALSLSATSLQAQEGREQTRDTAAAEPQAADTARQGQAQANQAQDTAQAQDTTKWGHRVETDPDVQNPPGYRGMQRDTTMFPPDEQQPVDTFLQQQGVGTPQDTMGYEGLPEVRPEEESEEQQPPRRDGEQREAADTIAADTAAADTAKADTAKAEKADTTEAGQAEQQHQQQHDTTAADREIQSGDNR